LTYRKRGPFAATDVSTRKDRQQIDTKQLRKESEEMLADAKRLLAEMHELAETAKRLAQEQAELSAEHAALVRAAKREESKR
jgi:hypothetical protein